LTPLPPPPRALGGAERRAVEFFLSRLSIVLGSHVFSSLLPPFPHPRSVVCAFIHSGFTESSKRVVLFSPFVNFGDLATSLDALEDDDMVLSPQS